ncbi:MAG: hypothetical protein IKY91_00810, partial [Akkermansia sp.]|nr:hypothetical protein [Akkermansia sp.]
MATGAGTSHGASLTNPLARFYGIELTRNPIASRACPRPCSTAARTRPRHAARFVTFSLNCRLSSHSPSAPRII